MIWGAEVLEKIEKSGENLKVKDVKKTANSVDDGCERLPRDPSFPLLFTPLPKIYIQIISEYS